MASFENLNLSKQLLNAINDMGFTQLTPIQEAAFPVILSGRNVVGIAQTGTGKTLAYLLPILQNLKFSKQIHPRILIIVPTRELVVQVVNQIENVSKYMTVRALGVYGGVNINTQKQNVALGCDVLVATPGRLYDLVLSRAIQLKSIEKLVIDEVDVMLDLGFLFQINNLFELLPQRRQNLMFSATMTEEVETLIDAFFIVPATISIAVSGTPLDNIDQQSYAVPNFYTKVNLLKYLLKDKSEYSKVLLFVGSKKNADILHEKLSGQFDNQIGVIHSNKSQNYRLRIIQEFNEAVIRILITTDIMARGLDLEMITHVINVDTPSFPENYMHRIGRTGRAKNRGKSILLYTAKEEPAKEAIESLMSLNIPTIDLPSEVTISNDLIEEERQKTGVNKNPHRNLKKEITGPSFHEKKEKNKKVNLGGSYHRELAKKYKKPKTRGDKNFKKGK